MIVNNLKTGLRHIRRSVSYSLINIAGLALGMTCALVIFSLVDYHLGFENFHHHSDRIYRFVTEQHRDEVNYAPAVPPAFGKAFREDYTFGEKVARTCLISDQLIVVEEGQNMRKFKETVAFAEAEFLEIFNLPLVAGSPGAVLRESNTAVITERIAKKYFGEGSAVGKVLSFGSTIDFTVVGVLKDIPDNTDLRSDIYVSFATMKLYSQWYAADDSWGGIASELQTYVRLRPGVDPVDVEKVLPAYVRKYRAESKNIHHYKLQPLADVHFDFRYDGVIDKHVLWALSIIGSLLVLTACLNFINLATAQSLSRAKEVGVRKTLGSQRAQLFWQFTTETGVIVLSAAVVAFAVSYAVQPYLNNLLQTRVNMDPFGNPGLPLFLIALTVAVTFLSSVYPGLILAGFKPVLALKGALIRDSAGSLVGRRALIVIQFTISQFLLFGLIVIVFQMRHFSESDLGFRQDAVVMIPMGSSDEKAMSLREQFLQLPYVENVSACFAAPASDDMWQTSFFFDNRQEAENFSASMKAVDENFVETFDLDLVAGRNLAPSDTVREFLVNEKFVSKLGLSSAEDILGRTIFTNGRWKGQVVGVVNDFHDQSFRSEISPIFFTTLRSNYHVFAVRLNPVDLPGTLTMLEQKWSAVYPEQLFSSNFLDEQTAKFYRLEGMLLKLVELFAFIAMFVGCLGLFGLMSFMAVQKTKEIGIRKVLGSSVGQLLWIFGREFSRLIIVAFLVAAPVGWLLMSSWLELYAYHVDMTPWFLVLEVTLVMLIVVVTVGYQSLKAAFMNPVQALRAE